MKLRAGFFENINKIDKLLVRLIKKKEREREDCVSKNSIVGLYDLIVEGICLML